MFVGYCPNEGGKLFEVPNFEAFSEPSPIKLTCQHCQTVYKVTHKGEDILFREKSLPASAAIKAEKYG